MTEHPTNRPLFSLGRICLLLFLIAFIYDVLFLRLFSHWWFEDDPLQFAFVKRVANPLAFFTDLEVIKGFGAGRAIVPFQAISEWFDSAIAYRSSTFAYAHNLGSLTCVLILLFLVLRNFGTSQASALILILLWLSLPASVVVNEFLSTRHYLEGFLASLGAVLVAQRLAHRRWSETPLTIAALFIALGVAALCKEVFAITVPLFVFFYLAHARRRSAAASALVLIACYLPYRYWVFGSDMTWGSPLLSWREYLQYLSRIPYTFSGNFGGYVLLALCTACLIASYRALKPRVVMMVCFLLATALASIYPISYPINQTWVEHGVWYRGLFFLHSSLLLAMGYFVTKKQRPVVQRALVVIAFISLLPGLWVTRSKWRDLMRRYKQEGKFYLNHEDQLIYSELPAYWYLDGVQSLYGVPRSHHVALGSPTILPKEEIARYETVWRFKEGNFVPDPALYHELITKSR